MILGKLLTGESIIGGLELKCFQLLPDKKEVKFFLDSMDDEKLKEKSNLGSIFLSFEFLN